MSSVFLKKIIFKKIVRPFTADVAAIYLQCLQKNDIIYLSSGRPVAVSISAHLAHEGGGFYGISTHVDDSHRCV